MLTGADRFLSARCLCFRRPLLLALWCLWKRNVHERQKAKRKQVICDLHQLTALYVMHITLHKVRLRPSECMPKTILLRPFHLTSIRYDDLILRSPALYMHKRYILIITIIWLICPGGKCPHLNISHQSRCYHNTLLVPVALALPI